MLSPFQFSDSEFTFRMAPEPIDPAVDAYPARIAGTKDEAAPYNRESLAELYAPRVSRLLDLQSQGYTHAAWGRLNVDSKNNWHGVAPDAPALANPAKTEHQSRKNTARFAN